jgi:hypothetical protein
MVPESPARVLKAIETDKTEVKVAIGELVVLMGRED